MDCHNIIIFILQGQLTTNQALWPAWCTWIVVAYINFRESQTSKDILYSGAMQGTLGRGLSLLGMVASSLKGLTRGKPPLEEFPAALHGHH